MPLPSSPRPPGGVAPAPNAVASVFLSTPRCPACGREPAIVFHVVQSAGQRRAHTRPVCLACCPKVAGEC
jgi:transposase-like protein